MHALTWATVVIGVVLIVVVGLGYWAIFRAKGSAEQALDDDPYWHGQ